MKPWHRPCRPITGRCAPRNRRGGTYWRPLIFLVVAVVLGLAFFAWRTASQVSQLEPPKVAVEPIVDGTFLGLPINDSTHDKFASNPWLRLAINSGHRAATPVRRYQIADILVKDGQYPITGEAAVIVIVSPKPQEFPIPPFDPIAVRRWKPPPDKYYSRERVVEMQRVQPPNPEDLDRLAQVWSGNRISEAKSLFSFLNRLLFFTALGMGFILVAGAYRSYQWLATRWDSFADQQQSRTALHQLRQLRSERAKREGIDAH